jgi:hypothetical protein
LTVIGWDAATTGNTSSPIELADGAWTGPMTR